MLVMFQVLVLDHYRTEIKRNTGYQRPSAMHTIKYSSCKEIEDGRDTFRSLKEIEIVTYFMHIVLHRDRISSVIYGQSPTLIQVSYFCTFK